MLSPFCEEQGVMTGILMSEQSKVASLIGKGGHLPLPAGHTSLYV